MAFCTGIGADAATLDSNQKDPRKIGLARLIKTEGKISAELATRPEVQTTFKECYLYPFKKPVLKQEDGFDVFHMPGLELWDGDAGKPKLPYKPIRLAIPYKKEAIRINIIPGKLIEVPGKYDIEHAERPVPLSQRKKAEPAKPYLLIYDSDDPYPSASCGDVFIEKKHGYSIVIINLFPILYQPLSKRISYYKDLTVEVEVVDRKTTKSTSKVFEHKPSKINEIKSMVDNPNILDSYTDTSAINKRQALVADVDYVIITTNALRDATGTYTLQDLIAQKEAKGLSAQLVTVEDDIYSSYSGLRPDGVEDNQTKIRNFIIDYYNNHNTQYVLLAGDTEQIPARKFWVESWRLGHVANMPVDMYYGCLDGTFDFNQNGNYGEPNDGEGGGEVDLFAEVYIGRAPVLTEDELSNFVSKTIAYETTQGEHLFNVYMAGEWVGFEGVAEFAKDTLEEIRFGTDNHGYTTVGFEDSGYADDFNTEGLYDADSGYPPGWDKSELINIINSGVHIINHLGHAYYDNVMKFQADDLSYLSNSEYFFGYSQGCMAGGFDNPNGYDCMAERFVSNRYGAFAVIMNARYGWGKRDSTDGVSQRYNREFWDALFSEQITNLGHMNQDSKEDNAFRVNSDCMRWVYYQLNLLGDPETSISTNFLSPERVGVAGYLFNDVGENSDNYIDPGDTAEFIITLKAFGKTYHNVAATLSCEDPYVVIDDSNSVFGIINEGEAVDNASDPLTITVTEDCPRGHSVNFTLTISANDYTREIPVNMLVYQAWPFRTGKEIVSAPVVADLDGDGNAEILLTSTDGYIYCVDKDAHELWKYQVDERIESSPAVADLNGDGNLEVVVGSRGYNRSVGVWYGKFVCLDKDGNRIWYKGALDAYRSSPAIVDMNEDGELCIVASLGYDGSHRAGYLDCFSGSGAHLWRNFNDNSARYTTPAVADLMPSTDGMEAVVGASDNYLYCIDSSGNEGWRYELPSDPSAPTISDLDGNGKLEVLVGSKEDGLYCLTRGGLLDWHWGSSSGVPIEASSAIADITSLREGKEILVSSTDKNLYCIDKDGNLLWKNEMGEAIKSSPVIADLDANGELEIIVASNDGNLNCISSEGVLMWSYDTNNPIDASPSIADLDGDGNLEILIGSDNGYLYCIDKDGNSFSSSFAGEVEPVSWPMFGHDAQNTGYYENVYNNLQPPTRLAAEIASSTSILLNWFSQETNETGFQIEQSDFKDGPWAVVGTVGEDITTYTVSGLTPQATYYFRVCTLRNAKRSDYSNVVGIKLDPNIPETPTHITTEVLSMDGDTGQLCISFQWLDNSTNEDGFRIEYATSDNPDEWIEFGSTATDYCHYVIQSRDSDFYCGTLYYFRVKAFNASGDSLYSDMAEGMWHRPEAPTNLGAELVTSSVGILYTDLNWSYAGTDADGFQIEYAMDEAGPWRVDCRITDPSITTFTKYAGVPGYTYYYRVCAYRNSEMLSTYTNTASITVNNSPTLSDVADQSTDENELLTFTVTASDPDWNSSITHTAENLPENASYVDNGDDTAIFTWTPDFDQEGVYEVTFIATDNYEATDSKTVTITVIDAGDPPPPPPAEVLGTIFYERGWGRRYPLSKAFALLYNYQERKMYRTRTNRKGRYVFKDQEPGRCVVIAYRWPFRFDYKRITIEPGETSIADLVLRRWRYYRRR